MHQFIGSNGVGTLHLLAGSQNEQACRLLECLLDAGHDPNIRTYDEQLTPAHVAAAWGNAGALRVLIAAGADLLSRDADGCTPLDYAVQAAADDCVALCRAAGGVGSTQLTYTRENENSLPAAASASNELNRSFVVGPDPDPDDRSTEPPFQRPTLAAGDSCADWLSDDASVAGAAPLGRHRFEQLYSTAAVREDRDGEREELSFFDHLTNSLQCCSALNRNLSKSRSPPYESPKSRSKPQSKSVVVATQTQDSSLDALVQQFERELRMRDRMHKVLDSTLEELLNDDQCSTDVRNAITLTDSADYRAAVDRARLWSTDQLRSELVALRCDVGPIYDGDVRAGYELLYARTVLQHNAYFASLPLRVRQTARLVKTEWDEFVARQSHKLMQLKDYFDIHSSPLPSLDKTTAACDESTSPRKSSSASGNKSQLKKYFCYLLMDPGLLKSSSGACLPVLDRSARVKFLDALSPGERLCMLVAAVFYVGKGRGERPLDHLLDGKKMLQPGTSPGSNAVKLRRIAGIWEAGDGVMVVKLFNHISSAEAFAREYLMIKAAELRRLTNVQSGSFGVPGWTEAEKRDLGVYLLYLASMHLQTDELNCLKPDDVS